MIYSVGCDPLHGIGHACYNACSFAIMAIICSCNASSCSLSALAIEGTLRGEHDARLRLTHGKEEAPSKAGAVVDGRYSL
jgi:hypothetical protein